MWSCKKFSLSKFHPQRVHKTCVLGGDPGGWSAVCLLLLRFCNSWLTAGGGLALADVGILGRSAVLTAVAGRRDGGGIKAGLSGSWKKVKP